MEAKQLWGVLKSGRKVRLLEQTEQTEVYKVRGYGADAWKEGVIVGWTCGYKLTADGRWLTVWMHEGEVVSIHEEVVAQVA